MVGGPAGLGSADLLLVVALAGESLAPCSSAGGFAVGGPNGAPSSLNATIYLASVAVDKTKIRNNKTKHGNTQKPDMKNKNGKWEIDRMKNTRAFPCEDETRRNTETQHETQKHGKLGITNGTWK